MQNRRKLKNRESDNNGDHNPSSKSKYSFFQVSMLVIFGAFFMVTLFLEERMRVGDTSVSQSEVLTQTNIDQVHSVQRPQTSIQSQPHSLEHHRPPPQQQQQILIEKQIISIPTSIDLSSNPILNKTSVNVDQSVHSIEGVVPESTTLKLDKSTSQINLSEKLWHLALGAAVPRGAVSKSGNAAPRLAAYESKRKGPSRHDGKAWKAGEAGCPQVPDYEILKDGPGKLKQGDSRLKRIHFVHPPKSGGTSFGQVVIAVACEINHKYRKSLDCCAEPADWCAENCEPKPDCKAIYGCSLCHCHHIPRLHRMADATYSVTIIRHPMTRFISGFFYRAHSPNWDRFNIRKGYFSKDPTYPFKFSFEQYLEMPEYHNILVKMFARDLFPYFNASLTTKDLNLAKSRLSKFLVVGINEAYDASVQLLLRLTGVTTLRDDQIHLPASMTSTYQADHEKLKARARVDLDLSSRIRKANAIDVELFEWSVVGFCDKLCHQHLGHFDKYSVCDC